MQNYGVCFAHNFNLNKGTAHLECKPPPSCAWGCHPIRATTLGRPYKLKQYTHAHASVGMAHS